MIGALVYPVDSIEQAVENRLAYRAPAATTDARDDQSLFTTEHAHTINVPVYSRIYVKNGTPVPLDTSPGILNTVPDRSAAITSIDYYDTQGKLIAEYIDVNVEPGPLASTEVPVESRDTLAGSGVSFIVTWNADCPAHLPVVQTVMPGSEADLDVSFRINGRPLTSRISPKSQNQNSNYS